MSPKDDSAKISVVFLGSGPVAAQSLKLLARHTTIEAVITKPRPVHHKGPVPVLDLCHGPESPCTNVIEVTNKAELSAAVAHAGFTSRLGVVIDFGIIITQDVIDSFELGIINSHFSLLPQWRGADPITFSILSGQPVTGVSLMRITAGLDEGPLLAIGEYQFEGTETTPELTERLIALSDALLAHEIPRYASGQATLQPQEFCASSLGYSPEPSFSRKLSKADGVLDFHKPALQLEREIRAFVGWPGSRAVIAGRDVVVTVAHVAPAQEHALPPGMPWQAGKQFGFYTEDGTILVIDRLKPAGKSEMSAEAFLAGHRHRL